MAPANAFAEDLGALGLAPAPRFFVPFTSTALGFKNKGFMLSITKENQVMDDFKVGDKVKQKQTARCDDPSALVPYVLLSGYHLTDLLAWDEACVNVMKELNGR